MYDKKYVTLQWTYNCHQNNNTQPITGFTIQYIFTNLEQITIVKLGVTSDQERI